MATSKLVLHKGGGVSKDILKITGNEYGVIYPLQSLRKEMNVIPPIPVLVDGSTIEAINLLQKFANEWASSVQVASDEQRLKLHVAAVVASNFTNHLYVLAEKFCKVEGVEFRMLLPLIEETASRLKEFLPLEVQTGPAVRNDVVTIEKHLHILNTHPQLYDLYMRLTESIIAEQQAILKG